MKLLNTAIISGALVCSAYADRVLTNDEVGQVVNKTAQNLREGYVFEDKAIELSTNLLSNLKNSKYFKLTESKLAEQITKDMRSIVDDGHLYAVYQKPVKTKVVKVDHELERRFHDQEQRFRNYGWERFEMLPGGVGYVENTGFLGEQEAFERATLMMNMLSKCEAIIFCRISKAKNAAPRCTLPGPRWNGSRCCC